MDTNIKLQKAVESFSNGKKESFNQIYELSYRYLHTCVIHVVKDEDMAMDVLQDTYLEVSNSIYQLKNKEGFLNWTATIANRKCYAYLRKQKDTLLFANNEDDEGDDFFENIADNEEFIPEAVLQNREKQRLIKEIIYDLTDIQRLCVIGFYYNEQKQEEIAQELGIPVNTVKSHLNRAKAKIKEAVVELDMKKGTRLYSMAPFMLLFFKKEVQACVLKPMSAALALEVGASTSKGSISGAIKDAIAKVKSLWTKASPAVKTKVVVGATVGTVVVGGAAAIGTPKIPDDAIEFNGHNYKLYDERHTWAEAQELCEESGGYLVVITSEEELRFIESINHTPRWIGSAFDFETNEGGNFVTQGEGQNGYICEWD